MPFDLHLHPSNFATLRADLDAQSAGERLADLARKTSGRIVFTTSFGLEDQAVTHLIAERKLTIEIVTLDTGRLFPETYDLWSETEARYGVTISAYTPQAAEIETYVSENGINGFRHSVEARKSCCAIRKLAPLARALNGAAIWVTGLRAEQSQHRASTPMIEHDQTHDLVKFNPLVDWTREHLVDFITLEQIPYNPLHDKGFASIGCAPCTRAIRLGEDERAGRWWWEADAKRECGLHVPRASQTGADS